MPGQGQVSDPVMCLLSPIFKDPRLDAKSSSTALRRQSLICASLALILINGCGRKAHQEARQMVRPVRTMTVGVSPESRGRAFPGQAEANEEAELSFRVGGSLIELSANVGDKVKKGQVLANLDPTDFQVRLRDAEAELSSAEANLEVANVMLTRTRNLFEKRAGPQVDVDRAAAQVETSKANIAALRTKRDIAQSELSYAQLTAPFDGVIAGRYAQNFQTVQAKQPILRLLDTSRIKFGVDLPETAMPLLPYAKEIWVTFQAAPGNKLPATIQDVSHEASRSTRTYRVDRGDGSASGCSNFAWDERRAASTLRTPKHAAEGAGGASVSSLRGKRWNNLCVARGHIDHDRASPTCKNAASDNSRVSGRRSESRSDRCYRRRSLSEGRAKGSHHGVAG